MSESANIDDLNLARANAAGADCLNRMAGHFKPGVKLSLMVRTPGHPDRDFMMSNDDLTELEAMISRRAKSNQGGLIQ